MALVKTSAEYGQLVKVLGKGSYGVVELYRDHTGREVAIKRAVRADDFGAIQSLRCEATILQQLDSPHIIKVKEILECPDFRLVLPAAPCNLLDMLNGCPDYFTPAIIRHCAHHLALALDCAHQAKIRHNDLHAANVLFLDDKLVVIDWGVASHESISYPFVDPFGAPETANRTPVDLRADIWKYGLLVCRLFYRQLDLDQAAIYRDFIRQNVGTATLPVPDRVAFVGIDHPLARDLIRRTMAWDYRRRPTAAEILAHPYFQ